VLVAGHAVYVADGFSAPAADSSWLLQDFQRGEPPFYIEHMREGVRLAAEDPSALLVFSGGQTRPEAGPRSEALGYWRVTRHSSWWGNANVEPRTATEEFARDSFENLLFGICRFLECTGRPPEKVDVVSWGFKRERFDMHREAVRFPTKPFCFHDVGTPRDLARAEEGEKGTVTLFRADPYGTGEDLGHKRVKRNPFRRTPPYGAGCPELAGLLKHRGPGRYRGKLPW
jgi:hypothetical protein